MFKLCCEAGGEISCHVLMRRYKGAADRGMVRGAYACVYGRNNRYVREKGASHIHLLSSTAVVHTRLIHGSNEYGIYGP